MVWKVARDRELDPAVRRATLLQMNALLPLGLEGVAPAAASRPAEAPAGGAGAGAAPGRRAQGARLRAADALRQQIGELGWDVRDTAQGPELRPR